MPAEFESPYLRVDWVHPSLRDLLIDRLAEHAAERHSFLRRCAIGGLTIAISTSGGSKGTRSYPLLHDEMDWEIILSRTQEIVARASDEGANRLLSSVEHSLLRPTPDHKLNPDCVARFVQEAIAGARAHFSSPPSVSSLGLLETYYRVSTSVHPLPAGPDLSRLWNCFFEEVKAGLQECSSYFPTILSGLEDWLRLVQVIRENEPRFLRQIQFPILFKPTLLEALTVLEKLANQASEDCVSDDTEEWFYWVGTILDGMLDVAGTDLDARVSQIRPRLEEMGKQHSEIMSIRRVADMQDRSGASKNQLTKDEIEGLSLQSVFDDL